MATTLGELAAIAPVPPGADRGVSGGRIVAGSATAGEVQISAVAHDSRTVGPQALFACLRGATFDGHHFVPEAADAGAVALLVDHELSVDEARGLPQLVVADTRLALGPIAADVAGNPADTLTTVGITGTNGKTSTAAMTAAILEANGWRTGVLGTLAGTRTTPEAPELQRRLAGFVADDLDAAVLEVSSHALALHRVDGTRFDVVASRRTRAFHHFSVGGELSIEDEEILDETIEAVTCRWCGASGATIEEQGIEQVVVEEPDPA